jgi:hypothetical protein
MLSKASRERGNRYYPYVPTNRAVFNPYVHPRRVDVAGTVWDVREVDGRHVPGAQGVTCLIFESPDVVRRFWIFPASWWTLDNEALGRFCEHMSRLSAHAEIGRQELGSAVRRAMQNIDRARELLDRMKVAVNENREARSKLVSLLHSCRSERRAMQAVVASHAATLREAGVSEEDASILFANAVSESATQISADKRSLEQFQRDTERWCALAYQAA